MVILTYLMTSLGFFTLTTDFSKASSKIHANSLLGDCKRYEKIRIYVEKRLWSNLWGLTWDYTKT